MRAGSSRLRNLVECFSDLRAKGIVHVYPELTIMPTPSLRRPHQSRVSDRGAVEHGDIKRAFVSYPALFKHLAFDGGFLHGVPEQLMRTEDKRDGDGSPNGPLVERRARNNIEGSAPASPSVGSRVSSL